MKKQSAGVNEVAINMENNEGPHEDEDKSSTPRLSNQQQLEVEGPPKIPKVPDKNEGPPDLPLDDEELHFMFNDFESSTQRSNEQAEGLPKIPKVPEMLRNLYKNDTDCFDPRVVSIGPYHHKETKFQEVEKLKTKLAWQYCKTHAGVADLYKRVKEVASEARKFYDVEGLKNIDDKAFTEMMFLDGCFILEFIMCLLREKQYPYDMRMKNNVDMATVKRDLFLLENQLPNIVLEALMEGPEKDWKKRIQKFITICRRDVIANVQRDLFMLENQLPYIVLEALMKDSKQHYWKKMVEKLIKICQTLPPTVKPEDKSNPLHLLDMMRTRFVTQSATTTRTVPGRGKTQSTSETDDDQRSRSDNKTATPSPTSTDWYYYHPARVLKSSGIRFIPNKTGSFSDVKFESHLLVWGVLTLPPIRIDAFTKSLLLNLLAFESSHTNLADNMQGVVTSYMCFMDSLIDNAEDVMILRTQNVINNCLGNDQLVADLFNEIASNLVPNPHTYADTKLGIQNHCKNKHKKWMAECHHIHFRNPWTLLALFGSFLLITLTAAQTYLEAMKLNNE